MSQSNAKATATARHRRRLVSLVRQHDGPVYCRKTCGCLLPGILQYARQLGGNVVAVTHRSPRSCRGEQTTIFSSVDLPAAMDRCLSVRQQMSPADAATSLEELLRKQSLRTLIRWAA